MVAAHVDMRCLLQRPPLSRVVREILAARLLLRKYLKRQNGQAVGDRLASTAANIRGPLLGR